MHTRFLILIAGCLVIVLSCTQPPPEIVTVPVTVEVSREVPVTIEIEREVIVDREVPVTVEVERQVEITRVVPMPVTIEVEKEVVINREVPVTVEVDRTVEVTREIAVTVEVEREVVRETVREIPVTVEVDREIEVTRQVPVTVIVEKEIEVVREVKLEPDFDVTFVDVEEAFENRDTDGDGLVSVLDICTNDKLELDLIDNIVLIMIRDVWWLSDKDRDWEWHLTTRYWTNKELCDWINETSLSGSRASSVARI